MWYLGNQIFPLPQGLQFFKFLFIVFIITIILIVVGCLCAEDWPGV